MPVMCVPPPSVRQQSSGNAGGGLNPPGNQALSR